jgi:hypothetical protein
LPSALASRIWQRRKVKASLAERRLVFKVSRSTSLKGRTKIGRFMPQRINYCLPSRLHMHYGGLLRWDRGTKMALNELARPP